MVFAPVLQLAVTTIVAGIVAYVAWRQWQTAREKLVLDLFEKRWAIYEAAESAVRQVMRDGDVSGNTAIAEIAILRSKAMFLFGPEVEQYLGDVQATMAEVGLTRNMLKDGNHEGDWAKRSAEAFKKIANFRRDFIALCGPYMKLTAKLPG